ncbi:MAG: hypothetical protein ACRECJ_03095 [Limisphaerales bacterium]
MSELTIVLLSLSLIVLTWAVVKINTRISETQQLLKEMGATRDTGSGNKATV